MTLLRDDLSHLIVPIVVSVLLTLAYFAVFDRWNHLDDPINSIVTPLLAVVGFAVGVGVDRWRVRHGKEAGARGTSPAA